MKTTKQQLRQIIKEELEVILTNEEAGELFGEGVEAQLEEQELNEDLGQLPELANMLGANPEELMIVLKAFAKAGANIGGGVAAGLGMSKIIDMIRDYREGRAGSEDQQELNEADMSDIQIIINAFAKIGMNLSPAIVMGLIGYAAEQAMGRKKAKPEDEQMMEQQGMSSDVARAGEKIGKVSGIEAALKGINTRQEFETLMMQFIQMVAKEKLKDQDIKVGIRNIAKAILQDK